MVMMLVRVACHFFFASRRRHTRSVSAFLLNRSSDLSIMENTNLSKHLAHNLGNLLLLGKIGVFHNRRNASRDRKSVVVGKECRCRGWTFYVTKKINRSKLGTFEHRTTRSIRNDE